jgi:hypothetical protein
MSGPESQSHGARTITVRGTARTGASGALILVPDELPVYLGGVRRWPAELEGVEVEVTGTVRVQEAQVESGARVHGLTDDVRVLEDATWSAL